jgi:hypothetical protein
LPWNGLTISGGFAPNEGEPEFTGGGIKVEGGVPTLNNCRITGNGVAGSIAGGGGIYNSGFLTVTNGDMTNNSAIFFGSAGHNYGSGIYNAGAAEIENGTFSGNTGGLFYFNQCGKI